MDILLYSARALTDDEAGVHGNTVVMRADEDLILPIYVAERLFEGEWRPLVGQYVSGTPWLQAYATSRLGGVEAHRRAQSTRSQIL